MLTFTLNSGRVVNSIDMTKTGCECLTCENMVLLTMEIGWLKSCRYLGAHASELLLEVKTHRDRDPFMLFDLSTT